MVEPARTPSDDAADAAAFDAEARADGFDEVLERRWTPAQVVATHAHPFAARAVITAGEMWLTQGEATRHLQVGDRFELASGVPHAERYGDAGAVYRVARRHR